jgi:hypothetical protein
MDEIHAQKRRRLLAAGKRAPENTTPSENSNVSANHEVPMASVNVSVVYLIPMQCNINSVDSVDAPAKDVAHANCKGVQKKKFKFLKMCGPSTNIKLKYGLNAEPYGITSQSPN